MPEELKRQPSFAGFGLRASGMIDHAPTSMSGRKRYANLGFVQDLFRASRLDSVERSEARCGVLGCKILRKRTGRG